jgi:hypothetical protein
VPLLTRRPDKDPHRKGWYVFFGDIRVGHIGERAGVPHDVDKWGWHCGFGPGCDTREMTSGTGKDLEEARVGFEAAWARLAPTKTGAHFELWRYQRDFTAWKYRNGMRSARCRRSGVTAGRSASAARRSPSPRSRSTSARRTAE